MNSRIAEAEALLEHFAWEVEHSRQVRDLAVSLFDQFKPLHQLGPDERDFLDAAALLHDIGWTVSRSKHHKHSYQLIRDSEAKLSRFTPQQVELIANVARYHRKALPSVKHEAYASLLPEHQQVVQKLAALLRLADGLDRPHLQSVKELRCEATDRHARISVRSLIEPGLHIGGASRKRELFEVVFGLPVEFSIL